MGAELVGCVGVSACRRLRKYCAGGGRRRVRWDSEDYELVKVFFLVFDVIDTPKELERSKIVRKSPLK